MESRDAQSRRAWPTCVLAGFLLLYLAAYWLLAFNVWDRYLLPVLPIWLLLMARVLRLVAYSLHAPPFKSRGVSIRVTWPSGEPWPWRCRRLLLALVAPGAVQAAHSAYPIGGDHGAYDGIDGAAAFIRTLPPGSVLYDHWLSWEWNYYLFGGPVYVSWFPSPDSLASDLKAFGATSPRYLAVPAWEGDSEVRSAAADAGFDFIPLYTAHRRDGVPTIVVYALKQRPPAEAAAASASPVTP